MEESNTTPTSNTETTANPSFTPRESRVRITYRPCTYDSAGGSESNLDSAGKRPHKIPWTGPHPSYGPPYNVDPTTGCWIWARRLDRHGYGYFRLGGKSIRAHRHYYESEKGEIAPGLDLDHLCRNRACVNPAHLEPVTHVENCRRGALVRKLSMDAARGIRRRHSEGASYKSIAAEFGIGHSLIGQVVTNRCWKEDPNWLAQVGAPTKGAK